MHLLRCLHFIDAAFEFTCTANHIPGPQNDIADDLSRDRLSSFFLKVPHAHPYPSSIPLPLLRVLMDPRMDWKSEAWTARFKDIVRQP